MKFNKPKFWDDKNSIISILLFPVSLITLFIIFLRKKMLTKIKNTYKKRKDELEKLFLKYNSPAFFVNDDFIPLEMTKYFNEHYHA